MNFELNDVASSSSSSQDSDEDRSGSSSCDHEVDEGLAYEVRTALHLDVGKICRAEDAKEKESSADGNTNPSFTMNKEAIVALTDLTYHYSTSLLAKDLLTFSKHAKRQTVKTDDVLLMARKDKGMAAELKRIMADNLDIYTDATKKKSKRGNNGAAQMRKNNIAKSNDKRSNNSKSKGKYGAKGRKESIRSSSSSTSSSSSSSSSSGINTDSLKERRKKLELDRKNQKQSKSNTIHRGRKSGKVKDDGRDLEDFIANDTSFDTNNNNNSSSSSDIEFDIDITSKTKEKKKKGDAKKQKSKTNAKNGSKKSSALFDIDHEDSDGSSMVIDLSND